MGGKCVVGGVKVRVWGLVYGGGEIMVAYGSSGGKSGVCGCQLGLKDR